MRPFPRDLVIGAVGLLIAGGLTAIALLGRDSGMSVAAMLGAGLVASAVGIFLFVEAWVWSQRVYRIGATGRAVAIALPPSSRGLGRHPFKVEITGSNPVGGTTVKADDHLEIAA